jgi:PHD/YefM family antitoxin component YafN of YafNO toxin-antitoxin module
MGTTTLRQQPPIIYKEGKPTAVILDIDVYEDLLEKLEDYEDLRAIEEIKKQRPLEYTPLEDYLKELGIEDV